MKKEEYGFMKRFLITLLCLTLWGSALWGLTACDGVGQADPTADGCTTVVCTNFAGLAFARSLLDTYTQNGGAGKVELTVLGKPGQDPHSYEPTAADIITLSRADVLVCTGAEEWLEAAVSSSGNKTLSPVTMMEVCDTIEGDHHHDHDHDHGDGACALIGQDEHVWLSVNNAIRITEAISHAIQDMDAENLAHGVKNAWTLLGAMLAFLLAYGVDEKYLRFEVKAIWWACFVVMIIMKRCNSMVIVRLHFLLPQGRLMNLCLLTVKVMRVLGLRAMTILNMMAG